MHAARAPLAAPLALALALTLLVLPAPAHAADPAPMPGVGLAEAWPGVKFTEPVFCVSDGSADSMFVGEQPGQIVKIAKWRGQGAVPQPTVWLDLKSNVAVGGQGGLLGCAFHPQHAQNGRVFVSYLMKGPGGENAFVLVVSEFTATPGGGCDAASEKRVLQIGKRRNIHQGGGLGFGPDGMLYLGVGDGGDPVSPQTVGKDFPSQTPGNPLGKILRMDVSAAGKCVPGAGNPWGTQQGWMPFIFAYGFRNPWQFDWDAQGRLWTAEPGTSGEGSREWVTEVKRGMNHGWPYLEGDRPFAQGGGAAPPGVVMPALVYQSGQRAGAAVAGKFYKGSRVPALKGKLIFVDYMRGEVYSLDVSSGTGTDWRLLGQVPECSAVGRDNDGEVYICSNGKNSIWTVIPR
ncbi:MAG: sorbosone dehydrogenase family protein [Planctomycetota bacterium]